MIHHDRKLAVRLLFEHGHAGLRLSMPVEGVALIPRCAECEAVWLPTDHERWRAYLGGDDLDEPAELFSTTPRCAEREFGDELRA